MKRETKQQPKVTQVRYFTATGEVVELEIAGGVAIYPTKEGKS